MTKWSRRRAVGFGVVALLVAVGMAFLATADQASSQDGPTVSIEDGEALKDGTDLTRLSALDVSEPALCQFTIDIDYDPLVKDATDCDPDPEDNFDARVCNPDYDNDGVGLDTVRVAGADAVGVTGDIPLADITWTAVGSAGDSTDLDVQIVTFLDCSIPPSEISPVAHDDGVNAIVAPSPPVGGIAQLPDASDSSASNYMALAGLAAAVLVTFAAGGWYARRRWGS